MGIKVCPERNRHGEPPSFATLNQTCLKPTRPNRVTPSGTWYYIAIAYLMMAAAWSVLFIAWPYWVDQVPPPQRLLAERTWYGLQFAVPALAGFLCLPFIARPQHASPQACSASGPHTVSLREAFSSASRARALHAGPSQP